MIHTRVCYVAEMLSSYNSVMFVKGGHQDSDMFISIGNVHHRPDVDHHEFAVSASQGGVEVSKQ